jgi:hypothetical protein
MSMQCPNHRPERTSEYYLGRSQKRLPLGDITPLNDEFELGRLHHRHVGRFLALENAASVDADLAIHVRNAGP